MLASTSVTFNTEDTVKSMATDIFSQYGLNMTAGLNLLLHAVIREGGIGFAVENKPSDEYAAWMKIKLDEAWERRKDPTRRVYTQEEMKARHNL